MEGLEAFAMLASREDKLFPIFVMNMVTGAFEELTQCNTGIEAYAIAVTLAKSYGITEPQHSGVEFFAGDDVTVIDTAVLLTQDEVPLGIFIKGLELSDEAPP